MNNDALMCPDKSEAKTNRERVSQDYGGRWHAQQDAITTGWDMGELPPKSLRLYELPQIHKGYLPQTRGEV